MAAPKGNKNAKGNKGGRPTSYQDKFAEQAYKLCLLGATDVELADFFEVAESTISLWKKEIVEFSEAIRAGKREADMEVSASLFKTAQDRAVKKQIPIKLKTRTPYIDGEGKPTRSMIEEERVEIIEVEEIIPGDFRSQQFWLKNRKSDKWRDKTEVDNTHSIIKPLIIGWEDEEECKPQ